MSCCTTLIRCQLDVISCRLWTLTLILPHSIAANLAWPAEVLAQGTLAISSHFIVPPPTHSGSFPGVSLRAAADGLVDATPDSQCCHGVLKDSYGLRRQYLQRAAIQHLEGHLGVAHEHPPACGLLPLCRCAISTFTRPQQ